MPKSTKAAKAALVLLGAGALGGASVAGAAPGEMPDRHGHMVSSAGQSMDGGPEKGPMISELARMHAGSQGTHSWQWMNGEWMNPAMQDDERHQGDDTDDDRDSMRMDERGGRRQSNRAQAHGGNEGNQQGQQGQPGNESNQQGQQGQPGNESNQQGQQGQPGNESNQQGQQGQPGNEGNQQGQQAQPGNEGNQQGQQAQPGNEGNQQGQQGQPGNSGRDDDSGGRGSGGNHSGGGGNGGHGAAGHGNNGGQRGSR
jgi:hypothetical protein